MLPHELYVHLCEQHREPRDMLMEAALRIREPTLSVSSEFQLNLLDQLFRQSATYGLAHVTHLTVVAKSLSLQMLASLSSIISRHTNLTALSLKGVKVDHAAILALFVHLSNNPQSRLSYLNLASIGMTSKAATAIAPFLCDRLPNLTHLDLSNNHANEHGVQTVRKYLALRDASLPPLHVDLSGNLVVVEMLNALTHGVGAVFSVVGAAFMLQRAIIVRADTEVILSVFVFLLSLFTLLTSSCVYHSCFRRPDASHCLRRGDHCSIFLLIAGTYTPFIVRYTTKPFDAVGPATLFAVWTCAIIGIGRSAFGLGSNRTRALFALLTGWIGSLSANTLLKRMHSGAVSLVVLGGLVYSVGIVFYLLGKKRPMMHVIWHLAVLMGGSLHYTAIWQYVLDSS
ncbi:hypothetical protein BWQ96_01812 [Gracilariopsis chorda]|uniref:Uncharacterized protein n=1 Tax=Gracilariopsis chorda TaxID=448386 RepID=A0A2V3J2L7_9FLOR|nr:hypothetical protein BWQ96_01812 [Gracilariopsis chorda]|eukprot:PXF48352.1 hypothetical protein BWQ96_01812 [Gracilariopsis chorda]